MENAFYDIGVRVFYLIICLICGFTSFVGLYEFITTFNVKGPQYKQNYIASESVFKKIIASVKLSNLRVEHLSRPVYARQAFLFMVFVASLVRTLFMMLQPLLPIGLFYLNYFIIIPSLLYFTLYTILSCYFSQLYSLFSNQPVLVQQSSQSRQSSQLLSYISKIYSYFQYILILFIPILFLTFFVVYATKANTSTTASQGGTTTTTTTTTSSDINTFQWMYLAFKAALFLSLLYSGGLVYSKIYSATSSLHGHGGVSGVLVGGNRIDSSVVVKRMSGILIASLFGVTASIIFSLINMFGRYENWTLPEDAIMYGLSEILPTFYILLHISKIKFVTSTPPITVVQNAELVNPPSLSISAPPAIAPITFTAAPKSVLQQSARISSTTRLLPNNSSSSSASFQQNYQSIPQNIH